MKRPQNDQRATRSPMARDTDHLDEDVTAANPVVDAPPRALASRYAALAQDETPVDYGDFAAPTPTREERREAKREQQGTMRYAGGLDDDDNPAPPPRSTPEPTSPPVQLSRERPSEEAPPRRNAGDGATMSEIRERIAKKREEKARREGRPTGTPEKMNRPEFAVKDPVQERVTSRPPLVDPVQPSATLLQIPEYKVFPANAQGDAPAGWLRQSLPSLGVPYDGFDEVFIRTLEVPDLLGIHASVQNANYSQFLDALNNALNVNIRELTAGDLRFLMYWWRLNSFSRSPYTVTWTSRYGNENRTMITTESELETTELQMSRDEYLEYRARGIDFPRVRDAEYLQEVTLSPTDRWAAERAQFIVTEEQGDNWYPSRLAKLKDGGIELLEYVRDFSKAMEHGVVERVTVTDSKYRADLALPALRQQAQYLARVTNNLPTPQRTPEVVLNANARIDDYLDEADEIERVLNNISLIEDGQSPEGLTSEDLPSLRAALQPREEAIALRISALDFFPEI